MTGSVRNESSRVIVEAQGTPELLSTFADALLSNGPTISRIDRCDTAELPVISSEKVFAILHSTPDQANRPTITPDLALCPQCLAEMRDDSDQRAGYPLINCTQCGPRYSIITDTPYDRSNTTMCRFGLCEKCHQQYHDPDNRRYHAQPVACPKCGPSLSLFLCSGTEPSTTGCREYWRPLTDGSPMQAAAKLLLAGQILAIKGIGGYHLAVRADDQAAVATLRARKHRDAKPFALMVADIPAAQALVILSEPARQAMQSAACPIVLARRQDNARIAASVAPGTHRLGVMLPYTPLQYLLLDAMAAASDRPLPPLVMTSANLSDEPLVKDDGDAQQLLAGLCDAILFHDRPIERCVDDSVAIDMGEAAPLPIRRSRGYVPQPIALQPRNSQLNPRMTTGLCVGGELKNTIAVVRDGQAILSQHLGDLKHPMAFAHFRKAIADFCRLFELSPRWIAHDLHPAYLSSGYATTLAKQMQVPTLAIQHHHAHAAAVLAEHAVENEALAIVCDGAGYGTDGTIWGGELLHVNMQQGTFARIASLPPFPLPGGDAAAKETRRAAAGLFSTIGGQTAQHVMEKLYSDTAEREQVWQLLLAGVNCPTTSSAGRWFDAVAALLGAGEWNLFEGQTPMRLEAMAGEAAAPGQLALDHNASSLASLPQLVSSLAQARLNGADARWLALQFHLGFAHAWSQAAIEAAASTGLQTIGLSGGCFCNQLLTQFITHELEAAGLRVLRHEIVPPNDGGIALGQSVIATAVSQQKGWH